MTTKLLGLIPNLSNDAYHKGPGASASDVIAINNLGFDGWQWRKKNPKESESLAFGTATHLMLEARIKDDYSIFTKSCVPAPSVNLRTKEGKEILASFEASHKGKLVLSGDEICHIERMIEAVWAEPEAVGYLQGGLSEPSVFAQHPEYGTLLKCRPDVLRSDDGISVNFKTARDASAKGFVRSIADYSNDWQSAFYMHVLEIHFGRQFNEVHLLVEKAPDGGPCKVGLFTIHDDVLNYARIQFQPILRLLAQMEKTGEVPRKIATLESPNVPDWAATKGNYE
jgi:hypothetical protein